MHAKAALTKYRIGANGYFKDFMADGGPKFLAGNLSKRYEQGHCGQARYAVDSAAFQRDNSKTARTSRAGRSPEPTL